MHEHLDDDQLLESLSAANLMRFRRGAPPDYQRGQYVYAFSMDNRWVKIGFSREPTRRFRTIQERSPVLLVARLVAPGLMADEKRLHAIFGEQRAQGEWFSLSGQLEAWLNGCRERRTSENVRLRRATFGEHLFSGFSQAKRGF